MSHPRPRIWWDGQDFRTVTVPIDPDTGFPTQPRPRLFTGLTEGDVTGTRNGELAVRVTELTEVSPLAGSKRERAEDTAKLLAANTLQHRYLTTLGRNLPVGLSHGLAAAVIDSYLAAMRAAETGAGKFSV